MAKKKDTPNKAADLLKQAIAAIEGDDNASQLARECAERSLKWLDRVDGESETTAETETT